MIKIIECPRDAMQGIKEFIPTALKIEYINQLLKVGFHTLDAGSFVSHKAIPQMADSAEVFASLDWKMSNTKLLAIVANEKGAEQAVQFNHINYLGFPLSVSETFQQRNTNASISEALIRVSNIQHIATESNKNLVVYLSMAFGNPYGDNWNEQIIADFIKQLLDLDIHIISLADTVGSATPLQIESIFKSSHQIIKNQAELGLHLHAAEHQVFEKATAAFLAGCQRMDGALKGFGGCPMAADNLVGNMDTEILLSAIPAYELQNPINQNELKEAIELANALFLKYH